MVMRRRSIIVLIIIIGLMIKFICFIQVIFSLPLHPINRLFIVFHGLLLSFQRWSLMDSSKTTSHDKWMKCIILLGVKKPISDEVCKIIAFPFLRSFNFSRNLKINYKTSGY
uniref:Uncharacterized protein n=1 Tax=Tetranychus urticae TaxID=32264 RepID=T1JSN5_TETUR